MKYKEGDKIVIGKKQTTDMDSSGQMLACFGGKTLTIKSVDGNWYYCDGNSWSWNDGMIDHEATAKLNQQQQYEFKVGDKARVTHKILDEHAHLRNFVGSVSTIKGFQTSPSGRRQAQGDGTWGSFVIYTDCLELVQEHTFKVGDKVKIPKKKTKGTPISCCNGINRAIGNGQDYLYINRIDKDGIIVCNDYSTDTGDHFSITDLEPYEEQTTTRSFRVGDSIRVVGRTKYAHNWNIGQEAKIERIDGNDYYFCARERKDFLEHQTLCAADMELIKDFSTNFKSINNEQNKSEDSSLKVCRVTATIRTAERSTGHCISGKRGRTAITQGYLTNRTVVGL